MKEVAMKLLNAEGSDESITVADTTASVMICALVNKGPDKRTVLLAMKKLKMDIENKEM
jgi:hypothetical protein